jgi:peptide/nickel transport system ATP-binding protein
MVAPVISVQGLEVVIDRGDQWDHAVKSLALTVQRGETFALVGESGSGKSMTAFALMRLLPDALHVAAGSIDFEGCDINQLPEKAMQSIRGRRIGMIFQEPSTSLNPVMRISDQLLEVIVAHTPLRGQAARERAINWLDRVGLPDPAQRVDDYPFQFSGGQKQRIMIAIALAAEPALLIADEPTTALDVTVQAQILDLLAHIQKQLGMAVLLITHDLAVVRRVANTVALMRHGEIVELASADDFFNQPKHPYARELFDAIPTFAKRGRRLSGISNTPQNQGVSEQPLSATHQQANDVQQPIAGLNQLNFDASQVVLSVKDLHITYRSQGGLFQRKKIGNPVVTGVDFELYAGQTLALLGGSGCGKTTIAKTIMRLMDDVTQVSGQINLLGQPLLSASGQALRKLRQHVQIVFQDPFASLDPRMRVGDILKEGVAALLPQQSASEREDRVMGLLQQVGLPHDAASRYPHEFSGGQRQRIAIARALAVSPRMLILDEPTSALDVSVQAQILDLLADVQRETGLAYLFITHNFSVVEYFADRVAVMHEGKIVELGSAETVLMNPSHEVTRILLSAVPRLDV